MAKKGNTKKSQNLQLIAHNSISLRQESTGKIQTKAKSKLFQKLEHLERLAVWASKEGSMPSLAALFGTHVAAAKEALCVPPDPSLFQCQRCETVLQPGFNCTVRIEKTKLHHRRHRHKKLGTSPQNMVVYRCHFCSYQNQKRGTAKGHKKEVCQLKVKSSKKPKIVNAMLQNPSGLEAGTSNQDEVKESATSTDANTTEAPSTPLVKSIATLLDAMKRRRKRPTRKRAAEVESCSLLAGNDTSVGGSKRRKKRCWTSLKEIAESSIKDITQMRDGSMMVTGQWFYRPEEAERKGRGVWQSHDTRELFYSFHIPSTTSLIVIHMDPLKLNMRISNILACGIKSMFIAYYFPELGTNLVPTLTCMNADVAGEE